LSPSQFANAYGASAEDQVGKANGANESHNDGEGVVFHHVGGAKRAASGSICKRGAFMANVPGEAARPGPSSVGGLMRELLQMLLGKITAFGSAALQSSGKAARFVLPEAIEPRHGDLHLLPNAPVLTAVPALARGPAETICQT
jgi:hypothetical protein